MMITNRSKNYKVHNDLEVVRVVLAASKLAKEIGFNSSKQNIIATITSELVKNIINHASEGNVTLSIIENDKDKGIEVLASDQGPGIENIEQAMQEHYSTKGTLGLGLPAVRRMADELNVETKKGIGTSITARKWLYHDNRIRF